MKYYIYKDKKGYWIKYLNQDGKWKKKLKNPNTNKRFATKKEAENYAENYLCENIDLEMTFDELFNLYCNDYLRLRPSSSAKKLGSWYKCQIESYIGQKKCIDIRVNDLERLSSTMLKQGYSRNYINKMTMNIKVILNWGVSHGYLEKSPVKNYKELKIVRNSEDIKFWTPEQFKKILAAIDEVYKTTDKEYIRYFLCFMYFTGLRKGEARALKWKNIDFNRNLIHVDYHINEENKRIPGRKNGNGYVVYMDDQTKRLMLQMKDYFFSFEDCSEESFIFPSMYKGFDHALGGHTPVRWVKDLSEYAKVPYITVHGLRHSAVSRWVSIGLNAWEIAERIGDTTEMVYKVYASMFNENKVRAAEKINKYGSDFDGLF